MIRSPPYLVRQGYPAAITNIFAPPDYFNPSFLQTLILDNESIQIYYYTNNENLITQYNAVSPNCNNLIIGDGNIEAIIKNNSLFSNCKFINYSQYSNDPRGRTILSTDEAEEIMLYLRNIPITRYNTLLEYRGLTGIYYNPGNQHFYNISSQIDALPQYNPGINVYKYFDIRQIERSLLESPEGRIYILVDGDMNHILQLEALISKIPNKKIQLLILTNDPNIQPGPYRNIITSEEIIIRFLKHFPMVS